MSLIEGFGDEVTLFCAVVLVAIVILFAWLSTHTTDIPYFRLIILNLMNRSPRNETSTVDRTVAGNEPNEVEASAAFTTPHQVTAQLDSTVSEIDVVADREFIEEISGRRGEDAPQGRINDIMDWLNIPPSSVESVEIIAAPNDDIRSGAVPFNTLDASRSSELHFAQDRSAAAGEPVEDALIASTSGEDSIDKSSPADTVHDGSNVPSEKPLDEKSCHLQNSIRTPFTTDSPYQSSTQTVNTVGGLALSPTTDASHDATLRRRRLAYFDRQSNLVSDSLASPPMDTANPVAEANRVESSAQTAPDTRERTVTDQPTNGFTNLPEVLSCNNSARNSEDRNGGDQSSRDYPRGQDERMKIRLVYLNDTQREVYASPVETIAEFRREHFAEELANNKLVRFIFNGQVLHDASTLRANNISNNSAVHCLITARQSETSTPHIEEQVMDLSSLMFPLFAILLVVVWYLRFVYRRYFNTMSTFSLVGITILFLASYLAPLLDTFNRRRQHLNAN